jgi:hypothetical protein
VSSELFKKVIDEVGDLDQIQTSVKQCLKEDIANFLFNERDLPKAIKKLSVMTLWETSDYLADEILKNYVVIDKSKYRY